MDEEKVKWVAMSFAPFKATGKDNIFPALIQNSLDHLFKPICKLFSASIAYGYIPEAWRLVKVVFIPKPGKASYNLAKSFRPISLTSSLLKMLERLIDRYISEM